MNKTRLRLGDIISLGEAKLKVKKGPAATSADQEADLMMSKRFGPNAFHEETEEEKKMTVKELMDQEFSKIIGHENIKDQLRQFHKKVQLDEIRTKNGKKVDQSKLYHMIFQGVRSANT